MDTLYYQYCGNGNPLDATWHDYMRKLSRLSLFRNNLPRGLGRPKGADWFPHILCKLPFLAPFYRYG